MEEQVIGMEILSPLKGKEEFGWILPFDRVAIEGKSFSSISLLLCKVSKQLFD
jgi:hypothetical protein